MIIAYMLFMADYFREKTVLDRELGLLLRVREARMEVNGEASSDPQSSNKDELIDYCNEVIVACSRVKSFYGVK